MNDKKKDEWFGLWSKLTKTGDKFLTGKITIEGVEYWINIFGNKYRKAENQPTHQATLKPVGTEHNKTKQAVNEVASQAGLSLGEDDVPF